MNHLFYVKFLDYPLVFRKSPKGHESIMAKLREGQVVIYDTTQNIVKQFDVLSGYAEMADADKLIVLLD